MPFDPGKTSIPASNAVITEDDKAAMVEVVCRGWLTAGQINTQFERDLSDFTGIKYVKTCNSGSSANLIAVATMVEAGLWKSGDEIITSACSFPTTVNPLLLYGLVPVFCDIDIPSYNVSAESVERAFSAKTRGIMLAHTLGNPFDPTICHMGVHTIADMCDALGSRYTHHDKIEAYHVSEQATLSTCSFFPAHHITCGEGGAVFTNNQKLAVIAESVRDWGRDCYCEPGKENTCGHRFDQQHGDLPLGYDHKYTYTRLGYNLKLTEIQASCGLSQLQRLPEFVAARRKNWSFLRRRLDSLDSIICPDASDGSNPSWFGFAFTIKEPNQRTELQRYLDSYRIGSRLLFCGNITRQPYMAGRSYRTSGSLGNADKVTEDAMWIGCHPHLTEEMLEFAASKIEGFFS